MNAILSALFAVAADVTTAAHLTLDFALTIEGAEAPDADAEEIRAALAAYVDFFELLKGDRASATCEEAQEIGKRLAAVLDKQRGWKRVLTAPYVQQLLTTEQWEDAGLSDEPGLIVDECEARWFAACDAETFGEDEPGAYAPHYDECPTTRLGVFVVYLDDEFVVFEESKFKS